MDPLGLSCVPGDCPGSTTRIDYTRGFEEDLSNFKPDYQLISGPLEKGLYVVSYHSDSPLGLGRSAKWWTTTDQANDMRTANDIHQGLALPPEWGAREVVSVAKIPQGTDITAYKGFAAEQVGGEGHIYKGGAIQLRFKGFDARWIIEARGLPK